MQPLPGVVFRERTQALAPTRDFARALLGAVGPVTAEQVTAGKGRFVAYQGGYIVWSSASGSHAMNSWTHSSWVAEGVSPSRTMANRTTPYSA